MTVGTWIQEKLSKAWKWANEEIPPFVIILLVLAAANGIAILIAWLISGKALP